MSELTSRERRALLQAWPDGPPREEIDLLRSAKPKRREQAVPRLEAMLELDQRESEGRVTTADLSELAARLGMGRTGVIRLRNSWKTQRSLAALIPYAALALRDMHAAAIGRLLPVDGSTSAGTEDQAPATPESKSATPDAFTALAHAALDATPSATNGEIARRILAELEPAPMSLPTAVARVQQLRLERDARPDVLAPSFGRELLVDACALDLFIDESATDTSATKDRVPSMAILCVVMETASRLVLGWSMGVEPARDLQRAAIASALDGLGRRKALDRSHAGLPAREVIVTLVPPVDAVGESIDDYAFPGVVLARSGPRRFGRRTTSLLGARLGGVGLRPSATLDRAARSIIQWSPIIRRWSDAALIVERAIERHTVGVIAKLAQIDGKVIDARLSDMNSALGRLASALDRSVVNSPGGQTSFLVRASGAPLLELP